MEGNEGFFSQIIYSISNLSYYIKIKDFTMGKAIIFLLLFSMAFGFIKGFVQSSNYIKNITNLEQDIKSKKINLELKDGEINISNSPYIINKGKNLIYIDTNIYYKDFDKKLLEKYNLSTKPNILLIFKDELILQDDFNQRYEINFKDIDKLNFGKSEILSLLNILKLACIFITAYYISLTMLLFVLFSIIVFIIGIFVNLILDIRLKLKEVYNISIYSLVMPTLLDEFLFIIRFKVPYFYCFYLLLAVVYLVFAMKKIKNNYIAKNF